jgi:hypothetical protein
MRRDYSKPHRLFVEDTPQEVRAILEEAAAFAPGRFRKQKQEPPVDPGPPTGSSEPPSAPAAFRPPPL